MRRNVLVLFLVLKFFLCQAGVACENCIAGEKSMNAADFFASALRDDQFKIALCKSRSGKPSPDKYELNSGESLLRSDFFEYSAQCQFLYVIEAIKGNFDRIVVYHEALKRGRIWPAFNAPSFIPPENTQWIVVFKYDPNGAKISFSDSDKELPVLQLADKEFGIIRYDDANHLGVDARQFLLDLRILVEYVEQGGKEVLPDELKTDLGKKILARISL
jgi:hypothetical protein